MVRERGGIPTETLMGLRRRLAMLPKRDSGRRAEVARIASLIPYGNEPEGMGVSQAVGDVGIGLSGMQMLS